MLDWTFYGNPLRDWTLALLVASASLSALQVVRALLVRHLTKLAARTHNEIDDLAAEALRQTRFLFLAVLSLFAGAHFLALPAAVTPILRHLAVLAIVVQGGLWGNTVIGFLVGRSVRRRGVEDAAGATTMNALGFLGRLLLWSALLLFGLDNLGVDVTALVAGLGVGGIAVALAVQNILGDLFASLSIVLDRPFVIGDFIVVDDLMGTVENVGLKTTRVRSLSGEQIVFSNADLLACRVRNYKRMEERRVVFTIGVTYGTPHAQLAALPATIREVVEAQPGARFDRAHFSSYGAFSLDFEIVYYVTDADYGAYMDVQQAINLELYERFEREGIDFAFPTQTLHLQRAASPPALASR